DRERVRAVDRVQREPVHPLAVGMDLHPERPPAGGHDLLDHPDPRERLEAAGMHEHRTRLPRRLGELVEDPHRRPTPSQLTRGPEPHRARSDDQPGVAHTWILPDPHEPVNPACQSSADLGARGWGYRSSAVSVQRGGGGWARGGLAGCDPFVARSWRWWLP